MKQNNIEYIDIMRGIAIIFVVIGHFDPSYAPQWYNAIHDVIYSFHMPLFLIISGYIYMVTHKDGSYFGFIRKKINRLMIPYICVSTLVIIFKMVSERFLIVSNPTGLHSFIEMFYLPAAGYYLWFVWVLFLLFVIVPVFKSKISHIILAAMCLALYFCPYELPDIFCMKQFQMNSIYFAAGMVIFDYKSLFKKIAQCPIYVYLLLFTVTNALLIYSNDSYIKDIIFLGTASTGTILVMQISKIINMKYRKLNKYLLLLSAASYFIYLFHTTFEGLAKAVIFRPMLFQTNEMLFAIGAILVVVTGVLIPYILFVLARKAKLTAFLFGISYRKVAK